MQWTKGSRNSHIENDNCCFCYYRALVRQLPNFATSSESLTETKVQEIKKRLVKKDHIKIVYANFCSDVINFFQIWKQKKKIFYFYFLKILQIGKPCYFVAVDFLKKKIVITIRGTESLTDSITDMQWKAECLPNIDPKLGWFGHEVFQ